ncbi:MAG: Nramp family divalent metal transporter [Bacillota bacterium]
MSIIKKIKNIGPGAMVAAAFIGPGTVTTATVTGASYGYVLMWAITFSIIATMILQEMTVRLGLVSGEGLGEALRAEFDNKVIRNISIFLVVSAVGVGAAAYETGNILGGAMGLETITGISTQIWGPIMGIIAGLVLWSGSYKIIEKVLVALVIFMSVCFVLTAIIIRPNIGAVLSGMFVPSIPKGEGLTLAISLIGTTIVPYNLFLHASSVMDKWDGPEDLAEARFDTIFSILLGGIITLSIIVTAAAALHGTGTEVNNAGQMAKQLEPLLGSWAKWFFAFGLFGAGFSSATTAPLAGTYATAGALGWERDLKSKKYRIVLGIILVVGVIGSALGTSPVQVIIFAQVANGILLPISAIYLIWVMNNKEKLGDYVNKGFSNILGIIVVAFTVLMGVRSLIDVLGGLFG